MHPRAILHPLLLALLCGLGAPVLAADFDPVTMNPPAADPPPRMDAVEAHRPKLLLGHPLG